MYSIATHNIGLPRLCKLAIFHQSEKAAYKIKFNCGFAWWTSQKRQILFRTNSVQLPTNMSCCPPGAWGELKSDADYKQKGTVDKLGDLVGSRLKNMF
jgi:hypothetical protein